MKKILFALMLSTASAHALVVAPGCTQPGAMNGATYSVDPAAGKDTQPGTKAQPWKTIQVKKIKPGDTVVLASGHYGAVAIDNAKLAGFATITAAPGAKPTFDTLEVLGSSKWIIQQVIVQSLRTSATQYLGLVRVSNGSTDIVFDYVKPMSATTTDGWQAKDWLAKARWVGFSIDGQDANSSGASCITISNASIYNVLNGIFAQANNVLITGSTLKGFGDDGFDFAGSGITITKNKISDSHDVGDANHNDAMQGQIGRGVAGQTTFSNILIDHNTVIAQETKGLPFPGQLQGIDAFDMNWSNVKVTNNVVVTNLYHGIAWYSVQGISIANNTVLAADPSVGTWIGVFGQSHQGKPTSNATVSKNIASNLSFDTAAAVADHNLVVTQICWMLGGTKSCPKTNGTFGNANKIDHGAMTVFMNPLVDLRLKPGSEAAGLGAQ